MRSVVTILIPLLGTAILAADPPAVGSGAMRTAKGIAPGGRGPARPRGEASALPLPAKGKAVFPVLLPFTGGPGLAPQPSVECALFGVTRPIHIRIVHQVNGKPFADAWHGHLETLFRAFDRNGDGFLNRYEFDYVFSPAGMTKLLQGKAYIPFQDGDAGPDFDAADKDKDGRVSFAEFQSYYADPLRTVVSVAASSPSEFDKRTARALFDLLDRNATGRVTAEDCQDVQARIKANDKNDDDCLSPNEIPPARAAKKKIGRLPLAETGPPLVAALAALPKDVVDQLVAHYDRDKDGTLSSGEIDGPFLKRWDADGDGRLSRDELRVWRTGEPDLVVSLSTGLKPEFCTVKVTGPNGAAPPAWATVSPIKPGHAVLKVDGRVVEFTSPVSTAEQTELDGEIDLQWPGGPGNRKPIRDTELANANQIFRVMFDHMDFDGDGVLTPAEYQKYLRLQWTTAAFPVKVAYRTEPLDLFKLLDENGDGRLSARELRQAYDKLRPLEPSPEPVVTAAALIPTASFRVDRPAKADLGAAPPPPAGSNPPSEDETVPLWFRKMDANNDGELTKKEFLGTAAQFRMLDANGDGVISVEEAKSYYAKRKK